MPAFCKYDDALACKLVTAYPKNADKGLPSVQGTVLLFDSTTGKVRAVRRPVAKNYVPKLLKAKQAQINFYFTIQQLNCQEILVIQQHKMGEKL